MDVTIIIVSHNVVGLLRECLKSIAESRWALKVETIVVDNGSHDCTVDMVRTEFPEVQLIANPQNVGFAAANNQGIRISQGRVVMLLNPDTVIYPGAVQRLLRELADHPEAGCVAPQLLNADGTIQRSCRRFPEPSFLFGEYTGLQSRFPRLFGQYQMWEFGHDHDAEVDQPMGACLLVPRKVVDHVGVLDEQYFMYFEEVDWCYRIRHGGYTIRFVEEAKVKHYGGQSSKLMPVRMWLERQRSLRKFYRKNYGVVKGALLGPLELLRVAIAWLRALCVPVRKTRWEYALLLANGLRAFFEPL